MEELLIGKVTLSAEMKCIPTGGLTSLKLRVELSEEKKPDSAWISELEVLGDLPWREGQSRNVKVRIMSDEFRQHVESHLPALLVKYGESVVGVLKFDESGKA